MKPADQPGARRYVAPDCHDLPVVQAICGDTPCLVTAWELDVEELAEIQRTGRIWLSVLSESHPPVMLTVDCPYQP